MKDTVGKEINLGDFIVAATTAYRSANLRYGIVKKIGNAVTIERLEERNLDGELVTVSSSTVSHTPSNCMVIPYPPTSDMRLMIAYRDRQAALRAGNNG